jgi:hypothetical protein
MNNLLTVVDGLPAHILFVHFVVVLVPLTALAVVAGAVSPAWARRMGVVQPLLGLVTLGLVPVTTHAGGWLQRRVGDTPLLHRHTELGDTLLPWATGLFLVSAALWWTARRASATPAPAAAAGARAAAAWTSAPWFRVAAVVIAVVVAAGAVVDVYRIGESGAKAAWQGNYSSSPR